MMVEPSGITVSCLPPPGAKGMSICPVTIRGRIASDCRLWRKSISAGVIHTSHIRTMAPLTVTWITEIVCKEQGTRDTSVTSHWLRGLRIFPEQSAGLSPAAGHFPPSTRDDLDIHSRLVPGVTLQ